MLLSKLEPTAALNQSRLRMRRKGFTLIELLVVVAIISILAAILLPALERAKANAQRGACISNLRQLGTAILMYAHDNNGLMPPNNEWWDGHGSAFNQTTPGTGLQLIRPCLATLYYQNYVPNKWVFYDPGVWISANTFGTLWYPERFMYPQGSPQGGWPDLGGNFVMGYMWLGGFNSICPWAREYGNNPISLTEYTLNPCGTCCAAVQAPVAIKDPSRVYSLFCLQWSDYSNGYCSGNPPVYRFWAHASRGTRTGINAWSIDGHVEWLAAEKLVENGNSGCYYFWWVPKASP